jgi:ferric-dicitrate binding protein FerR (iron transport regulator)
MNIDEQHFKRLLDAYLEGKASPAEKKLLDDFFDTYPQARPSFSADESARTAIWHKLASKLPEPVSQNSHRISPVAWYSIAAALALFVTASYFIFFNRADDAQKQEPVVAQMRQVTTHRGQKMKVELLDGSRVILNSNSSLEFPEQFTGNRREVYLEGEAYFEVAHDPAHPFIVHTRESNTTVLGTTFNIKLTAGHGTQVTLVEGKVDVATLPDKSTPAQHITLLPNQQALVKNGNDTIEVREVDISLFVEWKDNILRFENMRMDQVVAVLEDWYDVDIKLEDAALANCTINATYRKETLKNVLASLSYTLKVKYRQDGRKIVLQGSGCRAN